MIQRTLYNALLLLTATCSAGCCGLGNNWCGSCTGCNAGPQAYADCGQGGHCDQCGGCGDAEPCGGGCCGPLRTRGLFGLFDWGCCGGGACDVSKCDLYGWGCGKVYRGDYVSEPPACCEPCDGCGNWVGHGSHAPTYGYGGPEMYESDSGGYVTTAPGEVYPQPRGMVRAPTRSRLASQRQTPYVHR